MAIQFISSLLRTFSQMFIRKKGQKVQQGLSFLLTCLDKHTEREMNEESGKIARSIRFLFVCVGPLSVCFLLFYFPYLALQLAQVSPDCSVRCFCVVL